MSQYITVAVPDLYPYVLLMTGVTNLWCLIVGCMAGSKRRTIFDREFMKKFDHHLQSEEFTDAAKEVPAGGYPDMGNGLYGKELEYNNWYEFQLDQRAHKNFLEGITIVSFCSLVGGLTNPLLTLVWISVYFVARVVFTFGYRKSAQARAVAAPFVMLTPILMILTTIVGTAIMVSKSNDALNPAAPTTEI